MTKQSMRSPGITQDPNIQSTETTASIGAIIARIRDAQNTLNKAGVNEIIARIQTQDIPNLAAASQGTRNQDLLDAISLLNSALEDFIEVAKTLNSAKSLMDDYLSLIQANKRLGQGRIFTPSNASGNLNINPFDHLLSGENDQIKILTLDDLSPNQLDNLNRYLKKLPAAAENTIISRLENGSVQLETRIPGRVPGSYALYTKTIGNSGETLTYKKTTILPDGSIAHIKDKIVP